MDKPATVVGLGVAAAGVAAVAYNAANPSSYAPPKAPRGINSIAAATDPSNGVAQSSVSNGIAPTPGSMAFPERLAQQDFWMSFSFYEYQRPTFAGNPVLQDKGTIRLPLPNQLVESQGVRYAEKELNAGAGAALNDIAGSMNSGGDVKSGIASAAAKASAGFVVGQAAKLLGGNNGAAIGQLAGVALNPWLTVMFESPEYRTHTFSWTLTPTNERESRTIAQMITTFKFNMLPDSSGAIGGTLLSYPNIVQISINKARGEYWNYIFKPGVIKTFAVNYAPAGQPSMFNRTNAPTAIQISMTIQEIEYFLQRDYGAQQNRANSIGAFDMMEKIGL